MIKKILNKFTYFFLLYALFTAAAVGQIRIKQLPSFDIKSVDPYFFDQSDYRQIIPLNRDWKIYPEENPENVTKVLVPSSFTGDQTMVYEKEFELSYDQIINNKIYLYFRGVNYYSEILFNDLSIFKHSSNGLPFSIELPKDLFNTQAKNKITLKVSNSLDSRNTIPLKQRFLFPPNVGGLIRDVYLKLIPLNGISNFEINYQLNESFDRAELNIDLEFSKLRHSTNDTLDYEYTYDIKFFDENNLQVDSIRTKKIEFSNKNEITEKIEKRILSPELWSPNLPNFYKIEVSLYENDHTIDITRKNLSFYSISFSDDRITINGSPIVLKGVTYVQFSKEYENLVSYSQLESDLGIIKNLGFNTVRFVKTNPHPYAVYLCNKLGLLTFIDLPLDWVPEQFAEEADFGERAVNYSKQLYESYSKYNSITAIGLGSGYLADSEIISSFVSKVAGEVKKTTASRLYASFNGIPNKTIENIDLIGVELFAETPALFDAQIKQITRSAGAKKVFISSATYPSYKGSRSGYLDKFSNEAQAKYFEDVIDFADQNDLGGFFINSFSDYRGDYTSLSLSYNSDNLYQIGIINSEKNINTISYKVIKSKLSNSERVTVPIGSQSDDSPLLFIIIGLFLAVAMGILINSKRKFREDATRALLRPYNFFADIRDHRILSGVHSSLLLIILLGSHALLLTNIFFYLKDNLLIEKLLLSFGSPAFIAATSYLAWNPVQALLYLMLFSVLLFILITFSFKIASFFAKQKVFYSNIYFVAIWAILPLAILLPVELVLYRVLQTGSFNNYIFIFLGLYGLWIFQRIMKGIYVIFDVRAFTVYFYTMFTLLLIAGGILLYFQLTESTVYYILNSVKQYQLMKF